MIPVPLEVDSASVLAAVQRWGEIARKNGWGDDFGAGLVDVTFWYDEAGAIFDAVATRAGTGRWFFVPVAERAEMVEVVVSVKANVPADVAGERAPLLSDAATDRITEALAVEDVEVSEIEVTFDTDSNDA